MVPWSPPARPSTLVSWWQITARIQALIDHPSRKELCMASALQHRNVGIFPTTLHNRSVLEFDSPVLTPGEPFAAFVPEILQIIAGW